MKWVFSIFHWPSAANKSTAERPWLIDREGVVYKPTRKVVLRAKGK